MGTTKIKFETIDANNKTAVKSYGYANPDSTDYTLKSFVTGANALSKNRVGKIYRINTRDITSAVEETEPVQVEGITRGITSTSDFFSTNAETFHTFLQAALNSTTDSYSNEDGLWDMVFDDDDDADESSIISVTYGDLQTLLNDSTANIQTFASLLNEKISETETPVSVAASFANNTLTFTCTKTTDDALLFVDIITSPDPIARYIWKDVDDHSDTEFDTSDYNGVTMYGLTIDSSQD